MIFLTAMGENENEQAGFDAGAVDYIIKPISPPIVLARVKTHLKLKAATDLLEDKASLLQGEVESRIREVQKVQDITILALASLAEVRDQETGNHLRRTQSYVRALCQQLRDHPRFQAALDDETINDLFKSAPLHDIGKVGIPDQILLAGQADAGRIRDRQNPHHPGPRHHRRGGAAAGRAQQLLRHAREIAYSHQEKWDGSGYPHSGRQRHPGFGPADGGGRRLRRADLAPALQGRAIARTGSGHHPRRQRRTISTLMWYPPSSPYPTPSAP